MVPRRERNAVFTGFFGCWALLPLNSDHFAFYCSVLPPYSCILPEWSGKGCRGLVRSATFRLKTAVCDIASALDGFTGDILTAPSRLRVAWEAHFYASNVEPFVNAFRYAIQSDVRRSGVLLCPVVPCLRCRASRSHHLVLPGGEAGHRLLLGDEFCAALGGAHLLHDALGHRPGAVAVFDAVGNDASDGLLGGVLDASNALTAVQPRGAYASARRGSPAPLRYLRRRRKRRT